MKFRFKDLLTTYVTPAMVRWGAVGTTTFAIDYVLFLTLFDLSNSVFLANSISVTLATSFNYYTHHKWTFKSDQNHSRSGFKYLINLTFWWLISTSVIKALIFLNIDPKIAKLAPLILIVPVNYFVLNYVVFKKKS
jgi:putative flippase GtrA